MPSPNPPVSDLPMSEEGCGYSGCHGAAVVRIAWRHADNGWLTLCELHTQPKWWPQDIRARVQDDIKVARGA
jgi:hypothetical protein